MIECIRCGACCSTGPCSEGTEKEDGICKYLIIEKNNLTSCQLVTTNKVNPKNVGINNSGCILRKFPQTYEYYLNLIKERRNENAAF